jgi:hypothetical protein
MSDLEDRQRRLDRARRLIRFELGVAFTTPVVAGFLFIAAPQFGGGLSHREPPLIESLVPWAGVLGVIIGIVWMIRIARADPEAGESSWRYRDF